MLYLFYITTTPYVPSNSNNINRKELYDFYYTALTLTTGYNYIYMYCVWAYPTLCSSNVVCPCMHGLTDYK